jgi:hypothetical protein
MDSFDDASHARPTRSAAVEVGDFVVGCADKAFAGYRGKDRVLQARWAPCNLVTPALVAQLDRAMDF